MALRLAPPALASQLSGLSTWSRFTTVEHLRTVPLFRDGRNCTQIEESGRAGTKWVMQSGTGFSKRVEAKPKHKILTLDVSKASGVDTFVVVARKIGEDGSSSAWQEIGEILVETNANVAIALKERRKKLLAAAVYQHPLFLSVKPAEDIEYGYKKAPKVAEEGAPQEDGSTEITAVDVKGKEPEESIPAILRADDGTKRPSLKSAKAQYLNLR